MSPADQSWDFVLQRLDQISESIHGLRAEVNGHIGRLSVSVATLTQWKESHSPQQEKNTAAIAALKEVTDVNSGALKMLKLMGGVILGLIALGEFLLHARGP